MFYCKVLNNYIKKSYWFMKINKINISVLSVVILFILLTNLSIGQTKGVIQQMIQQPSCTVQSVSPTSISTGNNGGLVPSITVTTSTVCTSYSVSTSDSWISASIGTSGGGGTSNEACLQKVHVSKYAHHISGPSAEDYEDYYEDNYEDNVDEDYASITSAIGTSYVSISVQSNMGSSRTGYVYIGNYTVTVSQDGCSNPTVNADPLNRNVCNASSTTFSVLAKFVAGYQWQVNTGSGWSNISSAGSNPIYASWNSSILTVNSIPVSSNGYQYRCMVRSACGSNAYSNPATLTVNSTSVGGSVVSDQTICPEELPADLTLNGNTGSVLKWQKSYDSNFTSPIDINVANNTLVGSTIGTINSTTYLRAVVKNGVCPIVNSSFVTISEATIPQVSVSIQAFPTGSICSGTSITFTAYPINTEKTVMVYYQWKKNDLDIPGEINKTFISSTLKNNDKISVEIMTKGSCITGNTYSSNTISVNINPLPIITSNPTSVIVNNIGDYASIGISATGDNLIYQWQQSINESADFNDISGANTPNYAVGSVTAAMSKYRFRCLVSNTTCPTSYAVSNIVSVKIYGNSTMIYSQPVDVTVVLGDYASFGIEKNSSVSGIQWQRKKASEIDFVDIVGAVYASTPIITATEDLKNAQYRCTFTYGGCKYCSKSATLYIIIPSTPVLTKSNYIYSITPLTRIKSTDQLSTLNVRSISEQVTYYDGLGRPSQTVSIRSSPTFKDLVQPIKYDDYGRESVKYLPYEADGVSGSLRSESEWIAGQKAFYSSNFEGEGDFAKSVINYEPSPLNRVLSQQGPGKDWQNKVSSFVYGSNGYGEIMHFQISSENKLVCNNYYDGGTLSFLQTTDEDNRVTQEWKDLAGRVVLKRTITSRSNAGDMSQASQDSGAVNAPPFSTKVLFETYYAYDDMGRLRYVIPPMMVGNIVFNMEYDPFDPLVFKYGYYYLYDERGRVIEKRIPGTSPVYMVYDNLDRLVLEQDGELRKHNSNQWIAHTYDALSREIKSGIVTLSTSIQGDAQAWFNANPNGLDALISSGTLLVQSWYDTYDGLPADFNNYRFFGSSTYWDTYAQQVNGLLVAQEVRVLNPEVGKPTTLKTKFYYDIYKYRLIQTVSQLYDGGTSRQYTDYNFRGQVREERIEVDQTNYRFVIEHRRSYDHAERIKQVEQRIYEKTWYPVSTYEYDALGRSIAQKLGVDGAKMVQEVNNTFNIRGWLIAINNPDNLGADLFAMKLNYQNPTLPNGDNEPAGVPQYTGNITETDWAYREGSDPLTVKRMAYRYWYDGLSRLTDARWYSNSLRDIGKFDTEYTYYKDGNIKSLTRFGISGTGNDKIDSLTYSYNGNQLQRVTDHSLKGEGYNDLNTTAIDFVYNYNGSMVTDRDKDITVTYNILNLPQQVKETNGTLSVNYVYTATGQKLATLYLNGSSLVVGNRYVGPMVYRYDVSSSTWKPDYIPTAEGRITWKNSTWVPQYFLTDHLGNVRSIVERNTSFSQTTGWAKQVWQQSYYPYGMALGQPYVSESNNLVYNGKEKQDFVLNSKSLDWLDYGVRMYDATIGRWHCIDPSSEKYYERSPYNYVRNNPIARVDIDGKDDYFSIYTGRFLYSDGFLPGNVRMVNPFYFSNFLSFITLNDMRNNSIIADRNFFQNNPIYISQNILNYYYQTAGYSLSELKGNSVGFVDFNNSNNVYDLSSCDYKDQKYDVRVRQSAMGASIYNKFDYINLFRHERGKHGIDLYNASIGLFEKWDNTNDRIKNLYEFGATKFQVEDPTWPLTSSFFKQQIYNSYGYKYYNMEWNLFSKDKSLNWFYFGDYGVTNYNYNDHNLGYF